MREMALKGALDYYKGLVSAHSTNIEVLLEFGEHTEDFMQALDKHLEGLASAQGRLENLAGFLET